MGAPLSDSPHASHYQLGKLEQSRQLARLLLSRFGSARRTAESLYLVVAQKYRDEIKSVESGAELTPAWPTSRACR